MTFRPVPPGSPEIRVEPDIVRGPRVWADGVPIGVRRERGRPTFPIPMADGSEVPLTLHGSFMGLRARFEGREYEIEPRLRMWELFLVVLPLALLTVAWPVGAFLGALGVMIGLLVIRGPWPAPARAAAIIVPFVVVFALLGPAGIVG